MRQSFVLSQGNIMNDLAIFLQQNWMLLTAGLIVITLLLIEEKNGSSDQMKLSPEKAVNLINREDAKVLDLRSKDQYKEQHIAGSLNIPLVDFTADHKRLNHIRDNPIILIAASKLEGMRAIAMLKRSGKKNVYFMAGGLDAWREANMPIARRK